MLTCVFLVFSLARPADALCHPLYNVVSLSRSFSIKVVVVFSTFISLLTLSHSTVNSTTIPLSAAPLFARIPVKVDLKIRRAVKTAGKASTSLGLWLARTTTP